VTLAAATAETSTRAVAEVMEENGARSAATTTRVEVAMVGSDVKSEGMTTRAEAVAGKTMETARSEETIMEAIVEKIAVTTGVMIAERTVVTTMEAAEVALADKMRAEEAEVAMTAQAQADRPTTLSTAAAAHKAATTTTNRSATTTSPPVADGPSSNPPGRPTPAAATVTLTATPPSTLHKSIRAAP
jgi:hypothetical protein